MAIIQLNSTPPVTIRDFPNYRVQIRRVWADDWETVDYLEPLMVHQTIAPSVPMATFRYRYGDIKREDKNAFAFYEPLAVVDWYVRVDAISSDGNQLLFVGILSDDEYELHGATTDPQGDQVITAYGLEHLLDRVSMVGAYVDGDNYIGRTPTFNAREQWGGVLSGNRSELTGWNAQFSRDGYKWSHLDVICYTLRYFAPAALNVGLSGAWDVLDNLSGVYEFEGLTVRQILEKLIDRRRGLGWKIYTDGDAVLVYVFTVFEQDVTINGVLYPGNPDTYSQNFDTDREVESVGVAVSHAQLYDRIIVQGARVKSCFSLSVESGSLIPDWTTAQKNAYDDASDGERNTERFKPVYQRYAVPSDWEWTDYRGVHIAPAFDDQAVIMDDAYSNQWLDARPFLRELPIQGPDGVTDGGYLSPLVLIRAAMGTIEDGAATAGDELYYQVDNLSAVGRESVSVNMLDHALGFELDAVFNHQFGLNVFDGKSERAAEFDYANLLATVAVETDVRPSVTITAGGEIDVERTLLISVPEAQTWYVAPQTVTGVVDGQVQKHDGGLVRDDTDKLRNIAALAGAWYGYFRGIMKLQVKRIDASMPPGGLIASVSSAWQTLPVATIVSSVRLDMRAGVTMIETGFSELDFATLLDIPGMSDFRSVGRAFNRQKAEVDRLKTHLSHLPARSANQAGAGSVLFGRVVGKWSGEGSLNDPDNLGFDLDGSTRETLIYVVDILNLSAIDQYLIDGRLNNDLSNMESSGRALCRQAFMNSVDTIPAGAVYPMFKIGQLYIMQVPVWM